MDENERSLDGSDKPSGSTSPWTSDVEKSSIARTESNTVSAMKIDPGGDVDLANYRGNAGSAAGGVSRSFSSSLPDRSRLAMSVEPPTARLLMNTCGTVS